MRKTCSAAWLLAGAVCALPAEAQERPLLFRFGANASWDSNVFRVPDSAADPQLARGIEGKSDRYATGYFGLLIDKSYSQQRFLLDFTERLVRYDKFDTLDRDEASYLAEWQWRLGTRFDGSLRSTRSEGVVPFEDTQSQGLNETVSTENAITANAWLFAGWYLVAGASESKRRNSQVFLAQPDTRQSNHDLGVRYTTDAGNSITYTKRSSRGTNSGEVLDVSLSNDFTVHQSSLSGTWGTGGAQTLAGRLYWTEYRYPSTPARDFSGKGGEIAHTWTLTSALTSIVSASQNYSPWTVGLQSSYRVDRTLSFSPAWRASEKVSTSLQFSHTETDYLGAILPGFDQQRHDVQRRARVAVNWTPTDRVNLGARLERELRTSTDPTSNFDVNLVTLDASVSF